MEAIRKSKKVNDENFTDWVNSQQMSSDYNFSVRKIEKLNNRLNRKLALSAIRENLHVSSPMFVPNKPSVKKYKRLMAKKKHIAWIMN